MRNRLWLVLLALGLAAHCAVAQSRPAGGARGTDARARHQAASRPTTTPDDIHTQGVTYLNEAYDAYEQLRRLDELAANGAWADAVDVAVRLIERFGTNVVRVDDDAYVAVRRRVHSIVSRWPAAGLAAYVRRTESAARARFEDARCRRSLDDLLVLIESDFPTPVAADAAEVALTLAFEAGEFSVARQICSTFLAEHPQRDERRSLFETLLAVAESWEGRGDRVRTMRERVASDQRAAHVRWAGREVDLRELLDTISESQASAASVAAGADSTEPTGTAMFLGEPRRHGEVAADPRAEAVLWRFDDFGAATIFDPDMLSDSPSVRRDAVRRAVNSGRLSAFEPVAAGDRVLVHDHRTVWAIDPSGDRRTAWRFELETPRDEPRAWISEDDPPSNFTTTVDGGQVFVHLDRRPPDRLGSDAGPADASSLVCLSLDSGRLLWQNDLSAFRSEFEETRLDGAPLLVRDRAIAIVRQRKAFGFEACYLGAFDRRDGRTLWRAHLGEGPTGGYGYDRPTLSQPSADGDLVFVQTNLGTIAAVSASDGSVRWLRSYSGTIGEGTTGVATGRFGRQLRAWQYLSTMVWRENVIAAPLDSDDLFILQQDSGAGVARIPFADLRNPETIAGLSGDRLYLVGAWVVCLDLSSRTTLWERQLPEGELCGRPALATGGLFVPTTRGLLRFPADGGAPTSFHWDPGQGGNVCVAPSSSLDGAPGGEQILVASGMQVFSLVRRESAFARLEAELAARPTDAGVALSLAELSLQTREYPRGVAAINEAIRRAGGAARITNDELRRRMFDLCMRMAAQLVGPPGATSRPTDASATGSALELLQTAGLFASRPEEQVSHRLKRAAVEELRGDVASAVRTYQQVLADAGLRGVGVAAEITAAESSEGEVSEPEPVPAGTLAEQAIGRLIAARGPSVYSEVQRDLDARFAAARQANDVNSMRRLIDAHPNSGAVGRMLTDCAGGLSTAGRHGESAATLKRALAAPGHPDRPTVLRQLIDELIAAKRPAAASDWLRRAAREFPTASFDHGGRRSTFAEYGAALLPESEASLAGPNTGWPLVRRYARPFEDNVVLLSPEFPAGPSAADTPADSSTVLVWCDNLLYAIDARTGRDVWPEPMRCAVSPILLLQDRGRALVATRYQYLSIDLASGRMQWSVGDVPKDADAPRTDPEWTTGWAHHAVTDRELFAVTDRGELFCIALDDGKVRWRVQPRPRISEHLAAGGGRVAYFSRDRRRSRLVLLDAADGKGVETIVLDEDRAIQSLLLLPDGPLLAVSTLELTAFSPADGALLWRTAHGPRVVTATFQAGPDGVYAATDDGRLVAFGLEDGRMAWSCQGPPPPAEANLWTSLAQGVLYVAGRGELRALDAADGRILWQRRAADGFKGDVSLQPPLLAADSILGVAVSAGEAKRSPLEKLVDPPPAYRVQRFGMAQGTAAADLPLGPIANFRGMLLFDGALIVLDGRTLVGYVPASSVEASTEPSERAATEPPQAATSQPTRKP